MTQTNLMLGLIAQTSIHVGAGSAVGAVDLPIQREGHTGWPCIFGSSVKGAIRTKTEQLLGSKQETILAIFGSADSASAHAGAISVGDARLLLLPVRSLTSAFKWVTCPAILERFKRDYRLLGKNLEFDIPNVKELEQALWNKPKDTLFLEEYRFNAEAHDLSEVIKVINDISKRSDFKQNLNDQLVIVSNDMFTYLANQATPVNAHIALKDDGTKTVVGGALWYEETLPPETVMYSPIMIQSSRRDGVAMEGTAIMHLLETTLFPTTNAWLQIGGNETVGMGWCAVTLNNVSGVV